MTKLMAQVVKFGLVGVRCYIGRFSGEQNRKVVFTKNLSNSNKAGPSQFPRRPYFGYIALFNQ